jgi:hypothetical protein
MKTYGKLMYSFTVLYLITPYGGEWSASRPGRFTPGAAAPCIQCMGDRMSLRADLDATEKRRISYLCPESILDFSAV